ncbi:hypothetical protein LOTGIDRAFT_156871 [Lottia gigantea]|uniref:Uncharacterized protein n=1 Tax=Lottia gigantea TaxID=225164 RepID=V4AYY4_LOTGI|nr:hypothetical protein LOTGIDRAFT_156871 [Lottia gigantea]ESP02918.1 hypothetical protein LOTGIDRAFT_156871 [Lottia gigantea]
MKLQELQEKKSLLNERKELVLKKIGPILSIEEFFIKKSVIDSLENREIFQLVNDIHNLELKSLELDEKLKIVEIEKEVKDILKSFQTSDDKVSDRSSHLSDWYKELECLKPDGDCTIDYIKYNKPELKFNILYKGISVMISIQEIKQNESSHSNYKVKSDIFLENLEEKSKEFLVAMLPVDNLITFIKSEMEEDILPYISCDLTVTED